MVEAVQPQVLLLDEPFSVLDAKVRKELRAWLRQLQAQRLLRTTIEQWNGRLPFVIGGESIQSLDLKSLVKTDTKLDSRH